ncbi:MAG: cytochrome c oxidase subunit 3 [Anaerolineae bacterium]|nr:cytochrome c oxidase subunit 3 [Anaerolineae bacterium]
MEHTDKKTAFNQGLIIFIFLAVLTALEFFIAIVMDAVVLLIFIALIKAGLVIYYYMHINRLNREDDGPEESYSFKTNTNRLGMWLFLLSDSFVFGGLMVARINLLGLTRPHLDQSLGLVVTAVLLISSFFMNRAETAMEHGDRKGFLVGTSLTLILGIVFLLGVVGIEWPQAIHEGITASSGAAGAIFFMMTGMHAFHVLTGVIFLVIILRNGARGLYNEEKHWAVEAATIYWHFIDVVWIFFYPALYLIGELL